MMQHGLSGTAALGRSGTRSSDYREPGSHLIRCNKTANHALNLANKESFGFLLTSNPQTHLLDDAIRAGAARTMPPTTDHLTYVELFWVEGVKEHWLRFGRQVGDRIIDRRRRVVSFAPDAVFAFARWASTDYGTIISRIDIVRAVSPGEPYATVPHVDPGGDILLRQQGWPKVVLVFRALDAIDALGIAPEDVAPDYWRHVHNRLASGLSPRGYDHARHRAWLARRALLS
jgi:Protein of unknown function (DUF2840)